MSKSQPTYSKEFKQEAVRLFKISGKSKTQIAKYLGISDSAKASWRKEFGELREEAFSGKGHQIPIEEEK
jgi:transposase